MCVVDDIVDRAEMSGAIKFAAGAAALYAVSTQWPFSSLGIVNSTRRAADSALLVMFKTAKGTGR